MNRPGEKNVRTAGAILILCAVLMFSTAFADAVADQPIEEYRVKAAYLFKFAKFIEWPETSRAESSDQIIIGVLGKDPFGNILHSLSGKTVKGKRVTIKRSRSVDNVLPCDILFISSSEKDKLGTILDALASIPVVTVSEIKGFTDIGGIINFVISDEQTVRFEINASRAEEAGVKVSSKLLSLAVRRSS